MTLTSLQNDVILLGIFLLIGFAVRELVKPLQKLYIPASVIGGVIALIAGQQVLGIVEIPESWSSMSSVLINLIMTAMVFGVTIKTDRVRNYLDYALLLLIGYGVQIAAGVAIGQLMTIIWPGLPYGWGLMAVFAFWGGHGNASAAGAVFEQAGIADNTGMGMILATFGLIVAIVVGMILINWGIRHGYAKHLSGSGKAKGPQLNGSIPKEEQPAIGYQTVPSIGINSLILQLAFLLLSLFIGIKLIKLLSVPVPAFLNIPTMVRGMIGAIIVWPVMCRLKLDKYADGKSISTLSSFCLEIVVCSAIATLRLDLVTAYIVPILIMTAVMVIFMVVISLCICRHLCREDWLEKGLLSFGQGTGNTATGLALVRCVDPNMKSSAYEASGIGSTLILPITGTFPALMPLLMMVSGARVVGVGLLIVVVCLVIGRIFFWNK